MDIDNLYLCVKKQYPKLPSVLKNEQRGILLDLLGKKKCIRCITKEFVFFLYPLLLDQKDATKHFYCHSAPNIIGFLTGGTIL